MDTASLPTLNQSARQRAQSAAIQANLFLTVVQQITVGGIMILFATDVLGFPATVISLLLAAQPATEILRLPLLGFVEKIGTHRSFSISFAVRLMVLLILILLPYEHLSLPLFGVLLLITMGVWTIFTVTAWGVAMLLITTPEERGDFFGRMRASFQYVYVGATLAMTFWIGETITATEYRILLVLAAVMVIHRQWFDRRLPDFRIDRGPVDTRPRGLWQTLRRSKVFGPPLILSILLVITQTPAIILYLRQGLHIPSNVVTGYLVLTGLGGAVTLVLWGRLADAIGYRPFLMGLQILSLLSVPLLFLIPPFPLPGINWAALDPQTTIALCILAVYSFLSGAFAAGIGIGQTALLLAHIERSDAFRLQGLITTIVSIIMAAVTVGLGFVIQFVANTQPPPSTTDTLPWLHSDLFKIAYVFGMAAINLLAVRLLLQIPNLRPEFSMTAFFTALFVQPTRHLHLRTQVGADNEADRLATTRWLGRRPHPLAIDPLIDFLDDPSHDVRVEAIRSVALTRSVTAGRRLLEKLQDPEEMHTWDHIAWALGELRYRDAIPTLTKHLANSHLPNRPRAMCAGALASMHAVDHAHTIANAMVDPRADSFLRTACCRALLRLDAADHAEPVLRVLDAAEHFVDRYELVTLLSQRLGLDTAWLLHRHPGERMPDMLERWVDNRDDATRAHGREIIRQFRDNLPALRSHFFQATSNQPSAPWLTPLRCLVEHDDLSGALHIILAAWLIQHRS